MPLGNYMVDFVSKCSVIAVQIAIFATIFGALLDLSTQGGGNVGNTHRALFVACFRAFFQEQFCFRFR